MFHINQLTWISDNVTHITTDVAKRCNNFLKEIVNVILS